MMAGPYPDLFRCAERRTVLIRWVGGSAGGKCAGADERKAATLPMRPGNRLSAGKGGVVGSRPTRGSVSGMASEQEVKVQT